MIYDFSHNTILLIADYCHSLFRLIYFNNLPIPSRAICCPYNIMLITIIINISLAFRYVVKLDVMTSIGLDNLLCYRSENTT